ncbi:MAG: NUDIX domain-containing protein [Patescibacteria group bacterium]
MNVKQKLVILGLVENDKQELLVCQRYEPELPEVHLKWDLPGGTNEVGENLEETLRREFLEETGLEVEITNFMPQTISKTWEYADHVQHTLVLCFHCLLVKGELDSSDHKINDLKWVSKESINDLEFLPTTQSFINMIIK